MAPKPASAHNQRSIEAEKHAAQVMRYIKIFCNSTDILATDPARRNKLLLAKQQDPSTTAMKDAHPLLFKDRIDEALAEYEQQLAVEPKTFEENTEYMNELGVPSGPVPPSLPPSLPQSKSSPPLSAVISLNDAKDLVQAFQNLLTYSFFLSHPEDTDKWRVASVKFRRDGGPQYSIFFESIDTEIEMGGDELLEYLTQSQRVVVGGNIHSIFVPIPGSIIILLKGTFVDTRAIASETPKHF
ncbi:hypothetical protein BYT27DRAFT_7240378 [Phlegmacium glaucopus]|nr:hypothetical protein BYT27DRAFT_7240378 [Phlegmacium glaucopus]